MCWKWHIPLTKCSTQVFCGAEEWTEGKRKKRPQLARQDRATRPHGQTEADRKRRRWGMSGGEGHPEVGEVYHLSLLCGEAWMDSSCQTSIYRAAWRNSPPPPCRSLGLQRPPLTAWPHWWTSPTEMNTQIYIYMQTTPTMDPWVHCEALQLGTWCLKSECSIVQVNNCTSPWISMGIYWLVHDKFLTHWLAAILLTLELCRMKDSRSTELISSRSSTPSVSPDKDERFSQLPEDTGIMKMS